MGKSDFGWRGCGMDGFGSIGLIVVRFVGVGIVVVIIIIIITIIRVI